MFWVVCHNYMLSLKTCFGFFHTLNVLAFVTCFWIYPEPNQTECTFFPLELSKLLTSYCSYARPAQPDPIRWLGPK